jgi:FAD/FMN-containing dehydrogenase
MTVTGVPAVPVRSTSRVAPKVALPKGAQSHSQSVERLLASYRAVPAGQTVRLAKRTTNLFRLREAHTAPGLDVDGLDGVISIDPVGRTADVQGMCTYETLVAATLPYGLLPLVVPQLKTITLGGAVTGLGIESTSFRNGLPHESVLELDILTGAGQIVTARPQGDHAALFAGFPNSYGSLGYATRLRIELEPVQPLVSLRHLRFGSLDDLAAAIERICAQRRWAGEDVEFLDGVVFSAQESYLTVGRSTQTTGGAPPSDYTGTQIFYRSIRELATDGLTPHDYIWRWDADWFWCSGAFAAQNPRVRRWWPTRYRRSDVYHRIVGLENKYGVLARIDRWRGRPARERVIQDVEVPVSQTAAFLRWFLDAVPMTPLWVCPLALRSPGLLGDLAPGDQPWSLYPLKAGTTYVNVGFWGTVPIAPGAADGDVNREIEACVARFGGHKSLYSDAYYEPDEFWAAYGGPAYHDLKRTYDPQGRLLGLYEKTVRRG